ncbi:hypothetical protein GMOD_00000720 [Pyrenophora seminiperda CCB06]|uniref:Uncharacterized protein n=1 Tax=Pyrenophora seminiperda CCB06 TaxID=1302712 RepID=A0A3M7M7Y9_9PLEO|nr:hypothetical protein GMOD_00000720 [Pyrenophora seminiperda CCB06]
MITPTLSRWHPSTPHRAREDASDTHNCILNFPHAASPTHPAYIHSPQPNSQQLSQTLILSSIYCYIYYALTTRESPQETLTQTPDSTTRIRKDEAGHFI